jgi:ketosteroid isomerase-like protein
VSGAENPGEQLLRDVWRRWNAGEREMDVETFDPEFEVHSALTGDIYRGEERVQEWMNEIDQQFDRWRLEIETMRTLADGRVLARGAIRAHGRGSGIELAQPAAWIAEFRVGRLLAVHNFIGTDAAATAEASVS